MKYPLQFRTADTLSHVISSTGVQSLDRLLGGGYEHGMMYLYYGDSVFQNDLLRAAVWSQVPKKRGGFESPVIMIDSSNMIDTVKLNDIATDYELEIETVLDNIFVSRAFNSSQTYDLVINHLDEFLERFPAKLLILPGLPDLFIGEGYDAERAQQVTHMAARLLSTTLTNELVTLISTRQPVGLYDQPVIGQALASSAQVHIHVEQTPMRTIYSMTKHPSFPPRTESSSKHVAQYGVTLPLQHYFDEDLTST
jgi:DNA repair protein RadA